MTSVETKLEITISRLTRHSFQRWLHVTPAASRRATRAAPQSFIVRRFARMYRKLDTMKSSSVIFPFAIFACAACNKASHSTAGPPINMQPQVETIPSPPIPAATALAADPEAEHRAQLLGHINTLTNDDCDALVLLFQIIPRDEILNPLSEPKKELLRYVKRIASADELDAIERAIRERNRLSAEEPGTINRAKRPVKEP